MSASRSILVVLASVGVLFALSAPAEAAGTVSGPIVTHVRVDSNGNGMVIFDRQLWQQPNCVQTNYINALAFTGTNGKAILALALVAKATKTPLAAVFGKGTCSIYGGYVEDWDYAW